MPPLSAADVTPDIAMAFPAATIAGSAAPPVATVIPTPMAATPIPTPILIKLFLFSFAHSQAFPTVFLYHL